ncbi:GNAT family N-acetyltransferase [Bradyrhizobium sp. CCBAU 53421]|uniref:GNAT family N-acetyltransferase n=1 Tax=Bradyrhizobium sp. CCBAU 53421 TaxID=1325120 RepID=UPI00188B283B|nr:GNAT family N-acetyltransferase [Bradyrhizobium sp. CCBAU 53421]QOZ31697.1 GNAT family N-acetyltransferase [Bradyrhizobium sp. CCBAU 53421]
MCDAGRSTIRPARSDDAGFIARIVLAAQRGPLPRGWFDIALDWPEEECLAFITRLAVARVRSWYHVAHFLIAEVDGVPAAALCAMPASGTVVAARAAIEEVAAETGVDADGIVARGAYARNCWVQGGEGDWLIEHVAKASHRGRGVVQALIARALADGKAAGYSRASISFLIGNDAAERCYSKAGFAFAEEKRDAAFEALTGAPGFRRFARGM